MAERYVRRVFSDVAAARKWLWAASISVGNSVLAATAPSMAGIFSGEGNLSLILAYVPECACIKGIWLTITFDKIPYRWLKTSGSDEF